MTKSGIRYCKQQNQIEAMTKKAIASQKKTTPKSKQQPKQQECCTNNNTKTNKRKKPGASHTEIETVTKTARVSHKHQHQN